MSTALDRLKSLTNKISSYELARKENLERLKKLVVELGIDAKIVAFVDIFDFKAINLTGVSLSESELGKIQKDRYVQIISISYDKSAKIKSKNSSLGYFGRSDKLDLGLKNSIIEFVLRWRFEKSFMTLEHYHTLMQKIEK